MYLAGLIKQVQYPQSVLYEVNTRLVVIVINKRPLYLLLHVLCLLQLEHVLSAWGETRNLSFANTRHLRFKEVHRDK